MTIPTTPTTVGAVSSLYAFTAARTVEPNGLPALLFDGHGPTFVLVHGGPEPVGRQADLQALGNRLSDAGHRALCVDYRSLVDGATDWRPAVDDVVSAIAWARSQWPSDPVVVVAHSFGGYPASVAVLDRGAGDALAAVNAVVSASQLGNIGPNPPDPVALAANRPDVPVAVITGTTMPYPNPLGWTQFVDALAAAGHPGLYTACAGDHTGTLYVDSTTDTLAALAAATTEASTVSEGIDYASPGISPAAIVAAGKTFVGRYVTDHPGDPYGLSASEASGLLAAGLDLVLIWEMTADRAAGGAPAGTADGTAALAQLSALGAPSDATVYFVCQDDGTPPALASIDAYLRAASSALGRDVGCYAGGTILAHVKASGSARYLWRAAATSWGAAPAGTHLIQYATGSTTPPAPPIDGHGVDLDRATVADFGQWRAADVAGVRVKQAATVSTSTPWASFGTARTSKACKSTNVGTGAQTSFGAGADLGVVQLGTLVAALGPWPAGTPIVLTNVNGEQNAFIKAEVAFTPMTPPAPPAPPTQTVTVTGQNVSVTGPK